MILQDYKHEGNCHDAVAGSLSVPIFSTLSISMNYTITGVTLLGESASHCWIETRNLGGVLSCSPWLAAVLFIGHFLFHFHILKLQQNVCMMFIHFSMFPSPMAFQNLRSVPRCHMLQWRTSVRVIFESFMIPGSRRCQWKLLTRSCRKCYAALYNGWRPSEKDSEI